MFKNTPSRSCLHTILFPFPFFVFFLSSFQEIPSPPIHILPSFLINHTLHSFLFFSTEVHIRPACLAPSETISLIWFVDAAYANDHCTRRSTSSLAFTLCGVAIVYKSKTQSLTAVSSTEAEFIAAFDAAGKIYIDIYEWFYKAIN